ncbi:MBL fold metallo-hydrolase [Bordetella genomosp. 1]|uniref:MBL fold metallo-hydrolase n=1 Tax=Bordetella genomosp. 1 TaxID=1395607 RepID=A0ABX4F3B6_9BORD|nr:MBL fold metallo-hydrolase [Bordetella genomosp. 1]OZI68172.1 MBL fold metallo-hydrolase [Bordetella genomosp. 1]
MPSAVPPAIAAFYDTVTGTVSYVVHDRPGGVCAVIDPVLDFDPKSGRTSTAGAARIRDHVRAQGLTTAWILETHAHADHLSAAPWLQRELGGVIAIGEQIRAVQGVFRPIFNLEPAFRPDGSQFGHLFAAGETFPIGTLVAEALHVPGHTPADMAYRIGDAVFVGDTLFMPDVGTARCDFPGGSAESLYRSIRRLLSLPPETRLFMCHDYPPAGREAAWETTVAAQRAHNIHVHDGVTEAGFVAMRTARDATLGMPTLILPAIQVNIRAGHFPPPEPDGMTYLKLPVDRL